MTSTSSLGRNSVSPRWAYASAIVALVVTVVLNLVDAWGSVSNAITWVVSLIAGAICIYTAYARRRWQLAVLGVVLLVLPTLVFVVLLIGNWCWILLTS